MSQGAWMHDERRPPSADGVLGGVVRRGFSASERSIHRGDTLTREEILSFRNWRALVANHFIDLVPELVLENERKRR